jgi:hypothetical protein
LCVNWTDLNGSSVEKMKQMNILPTKLYEFSRYLKKKENKIVI